jgi:predicted amidohydrolase
MATSKSMRIAAVQFYTEKDTEKNWERTEVYIKKAAADKVDLIIFPE